MHSPLIMPWGEFTPQIDSTAFIAPTAVLIGDTQIAAHASVFFNCVLRGDINGIRVGEGSNIQDLSMLHVDDDYPCLVGAEVTVGHCVLLHGCTVEDGCLIGMGSTLLNGAVIGRGSLVAAGTVVGERVVVPPGKLIAGVPGKVRGDVSAELLKKLCAEEDPATASDIPEEYRGLVGMPLARKYRRTAGAYLTGKPYRPNMDLDPWQE